MNVDSSNFLPSLGVLVFFILIALGIISRKLSAIRRELSGEAQREREEKAKRVAEEIRREDLLRVKYREKQEEQRAEQLRNDELRKKKRKEKAIQRTKWIAKMRKKMHGVWDSDYMNVPVVFSIFIFVAFIFVFLTWASISDKKSREEAAKPFGSPYTR